MSRVHDALRRVEITDKKEPATDPSRGTEVSSSAAAIAANLAASFADVPPPLSSDLLDLSEIEEVEYRPAAECLLLSQEAPEAAPSEEFRALRTRLNHLQSLRPTHTLVVTSPSPAEGKSFTALNLALAQAQLTDNRTLLADFDFRRPTIHRRLQVDRGPGITDYLMGNVPLSKAIRKITGANLYVIAAGTPVANPLELLNVRGAAELLQRLPAFFNWIILDTPPLLFSADANLLSTLCDATLLVVRVGSTTIDTVTRALQSLCENNVVGIVANGARAGELYSKYTYYYSQKDGPSTIAASTEADDSEEDEDGE